MENMVKLVKLVSNSNNYGLWMFMVDFPWRTVSHNQMLIEPTMDPWKAPQLPSSQKLHGTSLQFNNIHVHSSMICQGKSQTSCVCFPDDLLHPSEEATWASKVGQNRRWSLGLTHYPKILCWSIPHPISFI
jgi:hypothetical protein